MSTVVTIHTFPGRSVVARWGSLGGAETGDIAMAQAGALASVHVAGTFGAASVALEGSNDGDAWAPLHGLDGTAIAMTAAGVTTIAETTLYVRPVSTGGTGSDISVSVLWHEV